MDAIPSDASATDVATALGLDFVATGCGRSDVGSARTDGGVARCTGTAPLTLTFAPVGSATLTRYRWTFGDGTAPSSERAPTHTYVLPGTYDVTVAAEGPGGSVSRQRSKFVEVTSNSAGQPCNIDGQCAAGLSCLCGEGAPCGDGFTHGICTRACATAGSSCDPGAACARLPLPAPPGATADAGVADVPSSFFDAAATNDAAAVDADAATDAPATFDAAGPIDVADGSAGDASAYDAAAADRPADLGVDLALDLRAEVAAPDAGATGPALLCLGTCTQDADCADGLVCRPLPGQSAGSWVSACGPAYLRRVGEPCRNARGQLDDGVCASGQCAALGALGLCSASCAGGVACPPGAACATFGDGRALCVAACSSTASCTRDPLLACETGMGGGALGFAISPPMPTAKFCAPRSCTSQADCAPSGTCKPLGVGAHCVAN
jgi:PKD repeat protein